MNSQFPAEEYVGRLEKARRLMEESHLDGLLLTSEANINYLTGYLPWASWTTFTRPTVLLIFLSADPVLIVQEVWVGAAKRESNVKDIRGYSRLAEIPFDILTEIFSDSRRGSSRIGAELGYEQRIGISYHDFIRLTESLPRCSFEDASGLLWKLRMIKSDREISYIKSACKGAFKVFESAFHSISEGTTEIEATRLFHEAAAGVGMDIGFIIPVMGPPSYRAMTSRPTERKLERGEMVWVDLSLICCDYRSDFSRAAVVGGGSDKQRQIWEDVQHVTMKGVSRMAPGVAMREVVAACTEEASRRGLGIGSFSTGRLGHGIGLMTTEPPHIASYDTTVLAPGMVLAIEPGIISDDGVFVVEHDVAITNAGHEILTTGFWDLQTIALGR